MSEKFLINKQAVFPVEINKNSTKTVHFIGIGGIGMSGLALFLIDLGFKVSGSDIKESKNTKAITDKGGTVFIGHKAQNISNAGVLVVSSAIKTDNPELIEAQKNGLTILHRSQILKELMNGLGLEQKQVSVGVAGTHGKTTTSGMASYMLEKMGLEPSYSIGGIIPEINTNAKCGKGNYFAAELDESDGTIEFYTPDYNIITNLEEDHLDHYTNGFEDLLKTFQAYVKNLAPSAKLIVNIDDEGNNKLLETINNDNVITYSVNSESKAVYKAKSIELEGFGSKSDIYKNDEFLGSLELSVPGLHNVSDALAVLVFGYENGLDFNEMAVSLKGFTGMGRRFQLVGKVNGATIVDDYAHHPTEIIATLKSAAQVVKQAGKGRIVAVFQPHRYSRFAGLWSEFLNCFEQADALFVTGVYSAGEDFLPEADPKNFVKLVEGKEAIYLGGSMEEVAEKLCTQIKSDDIVLSLGAGDITKLGSLLIEKYKTLRV